MASITITTAVISTNQTISTYKAENTAQLNTNNAFVNTLQPNNLDYKTLVGKVQYNSEIYNAFITDNAKEKSVSVVKDMGRFMHGIVKDEDLTNAYKKGEVDISDANLLDYAIDNTEEGEILQDEKFKAIYSSKKELKVGAVLDVTVSVMGHVAGMSEGIARMKQGNVKYGYALYYSNFYGALSDINILPDNDYIEAINNQTALINKASVSGAITSVVQNVLVNHIKNTVDDPKFLINDVVDTINNYNKPTQCINGVSGYLSCNKSN